MKPEDKSAFGYAVADVTRLYRRVFDRRATELELTRAQWRALKWIHGTHGLSQARLAEELDLEAIAVGRVIDRLEIAGFVERRPDPADRRRWLLYPAPKADEVIGRMRKVANALHADALAGVSSPDMDTTLRVLGQVRDTLARLDRDDKAPTKTKGAKK